MISETTNANREMLKPTISIVRVRSAIFILIYIKWIKIEYNVNKMLEKREIEDEHRSNSSWEKYEYEKYEFYFVDDEVVEFKLFVLDIFCVRERFFRRKMIFMQFFG